MVRSYSIRSKKQRRVDGHVGYRGVFVNIGVARIFDWGGPNRKSHAMTSSETLKEEFLWKQRYRRMEDEKPWPGRNSFM